MTDDLDPAVIADTRARFVVENALGRTLFVEAGAGTGKTTALVGRICQMVLADDETRRQPLSGIAAITFTEAAAAELRERIREEFETRHRDAKRSGDEHIARLCSQALEDADIAAISTLHSFAQRLLSEFPVEVGVPPRVEVIDEVQSQVAFDDRWSRFVDELFADDAIEEFVVRASILNVGIGSSGSPLRTLARIFDDNWDRLENLDSYQALDTAIDWRPITVRVQEVLDCVDDCTDASDMLCRRIIDAALDRFITSSSDIDRLRRLTRLGSSDWRVSNRGKKDNWPGGIDRPRQCLQAMGVVADEMLAELANQTLMLLSARIAGFTVDAAMERRAEGRLEFHDLLVLARQLLRQSPEARAALSSRYRVLMLDEFQDTDPIQIELALLLAGSREGTFDGDWRDLESTPGRLFMVGDPKQSIYRFRRADIDLFLNVRDRFKAGGVRLTRNFRTVGPIIEVVNAFFGDLMATETTSQAAYAPLTPARAASAIDHRPTVLGGPRNDTAREIRLAEAADVASVIDDVRRNPDNWLVADRGEDRKGGQKWRRPRLGDITILLPTRTSLGQLTDALDDRRIPYRADTGTLVYETQEIRDLLAVLRAIDDPSDQVALVAALRSSLYACGDDDLFRWRDAGAQFDFRSAWPDEVTGSPVAEAVEHLRALSNLRWWKEPSQLLEQLIEERSVFALAACGRRPRDSWRRIRYVLDQARAFSESSGGDLRAYLRWTALQGVDGSKAHEPMLPEPDDDAVQIMTIHGSKGLEFPIAIVSGLTTANIGARRGVEVVWGEPSALPQVKIKQGLRTAHFDASADLEAEMDRSEKDRLLYVALTRARDHLVVSGYHKVNEKGVATDSHGLRIHAFAEGPGVDLVRRFIVAEQTSMFDDGDGDAPREPQHRSLPSTAEWAVHRREVLAEASRPRIRSATALASEARSELADADDEPWAETADDERSLPPLSFRRGRAGTAIGSAVHGVLQLVDLAAIENSDLGQLVESQAWAESIPEHSEIIRRSVDSALLAPIVESCRARRHWKEVFVAAPVGDLTIEGYIDLLVETDDGLVVVDYKTDSVHSDADIDRKLEGYAMQGAAYAVAVETAVGRPVVDVQFVFARPSGPIVRSVGDLPALRARVRARANTA